MHTSARPARRTRDRRRGGPTPRACEASGSDWVNACIGLDWHSKEAGRSRRRPALRQRPGAPPKLEQALRIKRALEAAAERRESTLGQRIEKARSELSRVQAAIELKEAAAAAQLVAARRSHFAKLNDADVRVQLSRQSRQTKPPVAFEVASGDGSAAGQLPAAVIDRLQIKTRRSPLAPATDLATRKSITANARAAFARKDLAAVDAALAASKVKAAALKTATGAAARRGAAIARSAIIARAAKAKAMNARVGKAAVRRHASRARKSASLGRKALCAQAASGRRAAALVARATKAGSTDRATAAAAKRKKMDAAREARGHVLHLRALAAYMVAAERLAQKSSSASRRGPPPAVEVPPADEWQQVVVPHDEATHSSCVVA